MGITVKKTDDKPENKLNHLLDGTPENMKEKTKVSTVQVMFKQAKNIMPHYDVLVDEMNGYDVRLPENPDMVDISELNEKYALAQNALSRVSALEMIALDNSSRWERITNLMEGYMADKQSRLLLSEEVSGMKVRQQDAYVRQKMLKDHARVSKVQNYASEAGSFLNIVKVKKKDLASIMVTLARQVKVLSLDYEINNKPLNR